MHSRRQVLRTCLAAALAAAASTGAVAQSSKPITILVGFAPGGAPDAVARIVAEKLQTKLKRTVIVENKSGANGQLALTALQNGPTDGSVYALTPPGMLTIHPTLYPKLAYDVSKIEPVISACTFEHAVVTGPSNPFKTLAEYLAWVKANPNRGFYAVPALGSAPHFVGALLAKEAGVSLQPTPYRGGPPMLQDLLNGEVPLGINVLSNFTELHRSGKLRVLATTGEKRSALLPDVPTLGELGYKQAQAQEWFSFVVKAGTPASETEAFASAVREIVGMKDVGASLAAAGFTPAALGADELRQDIASDTKRWAQVIKQTGFKLEN
ncbi:tripartite tricarboxylate transporter substrate-binding protein [Azohydromonas australica]|uniref:tripartite tricarboxylate transporter substrate-binding protein n=1 Tax=Azohydromonas australica TaxID=364039 RepID=UPI000425A30A|nr:tripartite tricarboxylate transporter substrate-binding protein [Azohydromonas australica]